MQRGPNLHAEKKSQFQIDHVYNAIIFFGDNYLIQNDIPMMSLHFLLDFLSPEFGATRARLVFCCFKLEANTYFGAQLSSILRALVGCNGCNMNGSSTTEV